MVERKDVGGGRRIEDCAIERRIEYIDRGLRMVNFKMEDEGGRLRGNKISHTILQILILVMKHIKAFGISIFFLVYENVQIFLMG